VESYEHLLVSSVASPAAAWHLFGGAGPVFAGMTLLGVAAGVLIDLDHFLVQRLRDGDWNHLRAALSSPLEVGTDNQSVLEDPIPNWSRYLSHFIVLATVPAALHVLWAPLGAFLYLILGLHIACDIYRSWRKGSLGF
jgi:hypothetical protein